MNRTEKAAVISGLQERLGRLPNVYLTDFSGIAVKQMTDLRRRFRSAGVEYLVVKNTLAQRAFRATDLSVLADEDLTGPTGFVLSDDPIAAAKVIADFHDETKTLTVKSGYIDGRAVTAEDVQRLARLPSREQLLSEFASGLQSPLQGLFGAMNGMLTQFVGALEALSEQRATAA